MASFAGWEPGKPEVLRFVDSSTTYIPCHGIASAALKS